MTESKPRRPRGRPPFADAPMRQFKIRLTEDDERIARSLGDGNLSAGVRYALRLAVRRR